MAQAHPYPTARLGLYVRGAALAASGLTLALALAGKITPVGRGAQAGGASAGFISAYVAACAAWQRPGANVYDYAMLLRLNASASYAPIPVDPYTGSPALLVYLLPLTRLPFATAVAIRHAFSLLCGFASAFLLADL